MSPRTLAPPSVVASSPPTAIVGGFALATGLTAPAYADNRVTPGDFTVTGSTSAWRPPSRR
ncbi:MAG: hypothetical protein R2734_14100 [Nocardioides sp.]